DKPEALESAAVMMGFDLWKRDGKPMPPIGGLLSRPAGWKDEEVKKAGIAYSKELIDRVNALYASGGTKDCSDQILKDKFLAVQWRLARMNLYRAENYDLAGEPILAMQEVEVANDLNAKNETYVKLIGTVTKRIEQMQQKVTPREGLQMSLARADFRMARVYAQPILEEDEDDPDGNFAMGMYELGEKQLGRAEEYLKRVLKRKPNEAAVYNNLAVIQTTLGKFSEAKANVDKALELIPGSAAVIDTRKQLEAAVREAKAKKDAANQKK
ncbi:MAG: tetratricopeptide repeat protein, partial [Kiritimatiellae bacterium]|nr:tetratricopeptide repeat protein [Kiritimatiellia bacterium]